MSARHVDGLRSHTPSRYSVLNYFRTAHHSLKKEPGSLTQTQTCVPKPRNTLSITIVLENTDELVIELVLDFFMFNKNTSILIMNSSIKRSLLFRTLLYVYGRNALVFFMSNPE